MSIPVKRLSLVVYVLFCLVTSLAFGQNSTMPEMQIHEDQIIYKAFPALPDIKYAFLLGAIDKAGPYLIRVKLQKDGKVLPHTHPDDRIVTILSGEVYVGYGTTIDDKKMMLMRPGSTYTAPANVPHYSFARTSDVTYQESGVGPTGTSPIKQ